MAVEVFKAGRVHLDILKALALRAEAAQEVHLVVLPTVIGDAVAHELPPGTASRMAARAPLTAVNSTVTGRSAARRRALRLPSAMSRPRARITMRSVRASTSVRACEDSRIAAPSAARSSRIV
jgi:hypothetical protein